jgi:hypothetical protein
MLVILSRFLFQQKNNLNDLNVYLTGKNFLFKMTPLWPINGDIQKLQFGIATTKQFDLLLTKYFFGTQLNLFRATCCFKIHHRKQL